MKQAVEMEDWWLEPKIRSHSPHPPFFSISSLYFTSPRCQSFSPAWSIMSGHCNFESVKQSLSGQAVPLLRQSLSKADTMCESSTAIWLTTAVSHSNSSELPLLTVISWINGWVIGPGIVHEWLFYQRIWFGYKHSNLGVMRVCFRLARSEWRKSHTRAQRPPLLCSL